LVDVGSIDTLFDYCFNSRYRNINLRNDKKQEKIDRPS